MARQQEACKLHLAVIDQSGALAVGAAVLADAAVSALLQNSLHVWDRDTYVFFHPNRRTRENPEGPRPRSSRPAIAASEGCGRQRATACTSSRRHRRRFRRRGRRRRRSPSILSSHPILIYPRQTERGRSALFRCKHARPRVGGPCCLRGRVRGPREARGPRTLALNHHARPGACQGV